MDLFLASYETSSHGEGQALEERTRLLNSIRDRYIRLACRYVEGKVRRRPTGSFFP